MTISASEPSYLIQPPIQSICSRLWEAAEAGEDSEVRLVAAFLGADVNSSNPLALSLTGTAAVEMCPLGAQREGGEFVGRGAVAWRDAGVFLTQFSRPDIYQRLD